MMRDERERKVQIKRGYGRTSARDAINEYKYKNRRRKKSKNGIFTILIVIGVIFLSVILVFGTTRFISSQMIKNEEKNFTNEQMKNDIYLDFSIIGLRPAIGLRGKTRQNIYDEVLSSYDFDITIKNANPEIDDFEMPELDRVSENEYEKYSNDTSIDMKGTSQTIVVENPFSDITIRPTKDTYKLPDFLQAQLKKFIDDIYDKYLYDTKTSFKKKNIDVNSPDFEADFKFKVDETDSTIDDNLEQLARLWDTKATKGQIEKFDYDKNEFIFGDDHTGYEMDIAAVRKKIIEEVNRGNLNANIVTLLKRKDPEGKSVKNDYRYVSSFTTKTTDNEIRNTNIDLSCKAINGKILKSNEQFSFNRVVGERTEAKGYGFATAYNNGDVVEELGGGVCQVSTTLYNAVVGAGLTVTLRKSHTFEPNYVTPGLDATVSYPGVDFCFINDSDYAIGIRANYYEKTREVTIGIFGIPQWENDTVQYLKSKKIEDTDEPDISIIESGKATRGTKGSTWDVYLVRETDGKEVRNVHDHYSQYVGHTPTAYEQYTYVDKKTGKLETRVFREYGTTTGSSTTSRRSTTVARSTTAQTRATSAIQGSVQPAADYVNSSSSSGVATPIPGTQGAQIIVSPGASSLVPQ